ncbi:MAG TPA: GatB/YqeY domain-containing protein [Rhodothermales bacterium]|nr:GatB/YqeY domain-containing protein [Rhodothermales bacterium]
MSLRQTLLADLKDAMRARDELRLRTIRSLQAALQQAEIARRQGGAATLDEAEETAVVQKQAKQRRESMAQFEAAGRSDLAEKEAEELAVIEAYLPQMLGDEEIRAVVARVMAETGASGPQGMGRVMGLVMAELRGRVDGRRVQELVKEALG